MQITEACFCDLRSHLDNNAIYDTTLEITTTCVDHSTSMRRKHRPRTSNGSNEWIDERNQFNDNYLSRNYSITGKKILDTHFHVANDASKLDLASVV